MSPPEPSREYLSCLTRRDWLSLALSAAPALALLSGPGSSPGYEWKVVEANGRDYVTLKDIKSFYGFARMDREGRNIWLRSGTVQAKFSTGSDDIYINNVKFCLSFPTEDRDGQVLVSRMDLAKLIDPILRPTFIGGPVGFDTVVIDPGHGGHDSGAVGIYGAEKFYTLDTSQRLERLLKAQGYKTVLTRRTDVFIERSERVSIANRTPKCIFVSIHFNQFSSSSAIGLETFALAPQGAATTDKDIKSTDMVNRRGNERDSENIALATAVHANTLARLRSVDRGVKRARYDVIAGIEKPGILVEGGFVSNPTEGARIHRPDFRQTLAEAIAGGVKNYRLALMRRAPKSSVPRRSQ